ncbi:uncharacterized protein SAPINGB_P005197 [Magnusiomyces paraingens]|uniref:WDR5-like beta-propeller domain-containing protein n=1 Tax=Magnusiomyces paraingens TaxID=2606893 RepID=A0A5E8BZW1_9ASCO|nr:uncharacterized protein SAPINGB_P005197 [Saprochaete ingens]VVT56652.1 unnamed protein product [Saprochaete ingens]
MTDPLPDAAAANGLSSNATDKSRRYKCKYILKAHAKPVTAAKFSPNGKYIATCSADASIRIWDAYSGQHIAAFEGHIQGISDIAWSPDSLYLASVSDDKTVRVWEVSKDAGLLPEPGSGMQAARILRVMRGHTHHINSVDYNFKGNLLVSGSADENLRIWDVRHSRCLRTLAAHSDPVTTVCFSSDGTIIASASQDGLIRLWDTRTGHCLKTLVGKTNVPVMYLRFSPNSKFLLASTMDATLRLWDYMRDKVVKTYKAEDLDEHRYSSSSIFIPHDRPLIAQGMGLNSITVWDLQDRIVVETLKGHTDVVLGLDIHPTENLLVSSSKDGTCRLWQGL